MGSGFVYIKELKVYVNENVKQELSFKSSWNVDLVGVRNV